MKRQQIINFAVKVRKFSFVQILQETMISLFPIALVGSFSWLIYANFLSSNGFLGGVFHVTSWFPQYRFFRALFNDVTTVTIGWLATYAAMVSAYLTTKHYHRKNPFIGIAATACYVLIFYHDFRNNPAMIDTRYYTAGWFIVGVLVGYLVGRTFVKFSEPAVHESKYFGNDQSLNKIVPSIKPFLIVFGSAFIIHLLYAIFRSFGLDASITQNLTSMLNHRSNYYLNIVLSLISTVGIWFGFAEPWSFSSQVFDNEVFSNLNYALTHKTTWNIPYPFTPSALYGGFSQFGGAGLSLALLIAILWVSHRKSQRTVAKLSALPTFFNLPAGLSFGIGLFLNPIYLIPYILLPIFNMLIGSSLILLHLMPALVYPAPSQTPGILVPFISSGGNWPALLFSLLLLVVDVILYIPFVKMADDVEQKLMKGDAEDE